MKKRISKINILVILIISILSGCSSPEGSGIGVMRIPKENKVELDKVFEIQMDVQQSNHAIDGDRLYIITWNHSIYIIDIPTGDLIKSFKLDTEEIGEEEGMYSAGIAVYDGIMAINYDNKIIVVDTNTEEVILKHIVSKGSHVSVAHNILMYENILVYSNIMDRRMYAIDYRTGEIQWTYGGNPQEHGSLKLRKYKEKFLYTKSIDHIYYEFDPLTGKTIEEYEVVLGKEIWNENQDAYLPTVIGVEDDDFRTWLTDSTFDVFNFTDKGYMYTTYREKFYFHGTDGNLQWDKSFTKEIYITRGYGRYAILDLRDQVAILDLEMQEIVWSIDYEIASKQRSFIHEDRLYLFGLDGSIKVFDLSKLEQ